MSQATRASGSPPQRRSLHFRRRFSRGAFFIFAGNSSPFILAHALLARYQVHGNDADRCRAGDPAEAEHREPAKHVVRAGYKPVFFSAEDGLRWRAKMAKLPSGADQGQTKSPDWRERLTVSTSHCALYLFQVSA